MAVVNSIGLMNSLNAMQSKTGIGGLSSGMDIDELVVGLTSSGRQKIANEQQNIQKLEWKQDAYRSVIKALEKFQASYLDVLSKTNFRSASFFSVKSADVSSSLVSVIPSSTAQSGQIVINSIDHIAEAQRTTSGHSISASLVGKADVAMLEGEELQALMETLEDQAITLVLDGRVKTVQFDADFRASAEQNGLAEALQGAVDRAFGVLQEADRMITVSAGDGKLTFDAPGSTLSIRSVGGEEGSIAAVEALGFEEDQGNRVSMFRSLGEVELAGALDGDAFEFSINGVEFSFDRSHGLSDIIKAVNASEAGVTMHYSALSDTLSFTSNETGAGERIAIEETQGNLLSVLGLTKESGANIEYGKNAQLTVNGIQITRSSNVFTVDGMSIEIHGTTGENAEPIRINVRDDSSAVRDSMESFISDYNDMVDLINGLMTEKPNPKYPPLTDDQKNEMSEKQIEQWESKAKQGMLTNDSVLRSLLSDLRSAMTGPIGSGNIRLSDLGITSGSYMEGSKLVISDKAKFEEALKTKGDLIARLFTDADKGIAQKLYEAIDGAVRRTGAEDKKGRLINLAGIDKSTTESKNSLSKMIEQANKRIEVLKQRLAADEKRLWSKFTAMETALQRFEAQSSMLMQFTFN
ncbi:MAG: flagellar filament capping protein FliD [Anaerovoracaceae bacterium]